MTKQTSTAGVGAKLGLAFSLDFRDKDGNVLKTIHCKGSVPLADTGMSVDQAQQLINQQESQHGPDDRQ